MTNAAVNEKSISVDEVTNENEERLKYYELLYIHGGRKRKCCSKGIRQSSTFQKDCPFRISLRLSNAGTKLVVCSINERAREPRGQRRKFPILSQGTKTFGRSKVVC